jgi:hypothetical protein
MLAVACAVDRRQRKFLHASGPTIGVGIGIFREVLFSFIEGGLHKGLLLLEGLKRRLAGFTGLLRIELLRRNKL